MQQREAILAELISLIAGRTREPDWLRPGLEKAAKAIQFANHASNMHPSRVDYHNQLVKLKDASVQVLNLLDDAPMMNALEAIDQDGLDVIRRAWHSMQELAPILECAIESFPMGKGNYKYDPRGGLSPQRMCAEFVCVAWKEVQGRDLSHTSRAPQVACSHLWALAGDVHRPNSSGDPNSVRGWLSHLAAGKAMDENGGDYLRYRNLLRPAAS